MYKEKLLACKQPELTSDIRQQVSKMEKTIGKEVSGRYSGYFSIGVEKGILKIAVFFPEEVYAGVFTPAYLVFFVKKEVRYYTFDLRKEKWRDSMLENLESNASRFANIYISPQGIQMIRKYFCEEGDGYRILKNYQRNVLYQKRLRRDKRKTDLWDKKMKQVPKLPKNWKHWVVTTGVSEHYMFYSYKKGGAKEGYCTHCQKMVPIQNPKYNEIKKCSGCGHTIQYKSIGKFGCIVTKPVIVQIFQGCQSGIVLRKFRAYLRYDQENYQNSDIYCMEQERLFYDKEWNCEPYYFGEFKRRGFRWIAGRMYYFSYHVKTYGRTYEKNLPYLEQNELKKTGLVPAMRQVEIDPEHYLSCLKSEPILEKIAKADLHQLTYEMLKYGYHLQYSQNSSSLSTALEINKGQLRRLRRMNGGKHCLVWLRYEKKYGKQIADDVIAWFARFYLLPDYLAIALNRMSPVQIKNYLMR